MIGHLIHHFVGNNINITSNDAVLAYEDDARKPLGSSREHTFHQGWEDVLED
jgi:hypothetical protein